MIKRSRLKTKPANPNLHSVHEFVFKGHIVTPGMQFRVKGDYLTYTFRRLVTNITTGSTWIEAMTEVGFKFPRPEKVTKLVGIKRSYRKKVAV